MDSKSSMQQCLSHIDQAKREIEMVGRSVNIAAVRAEIDAAYINLDDSWTHCNTAFQKL